MLIVSCSHGRHLGDLVASKLKRRHERLFVDKFPDSEMYIRFNSNLRNKNAVIEEKVEKNSFTIFKNIN